MRTDPRVVLKERTNLRYLTSAELYGPGDPWPDLATADVSFISLKLVLAPLWQLLLPPREVLLLVKPQFEAGREHVGKNGVVRDPAVHREVIAAVWQAAQALGWGYRGLCPRQLRPGGQPRVLAVVVDGGRPIPNARDDRGGSACSEGGALTRKR